MWMPSYPGQARLDRRLHRVHRGFDLVEVVADQGRQEAGGSELAVRGADRCDRLDAGVVVEQPPAAAIDLHIDEAGDEDAAIEVPDLDVRGHVLLADDRLDPIAVDQHAPALDERAVDQHSPVDERDAHHSVSVTLARCGGRSGSSPRATASALAAR